MNRTINKLANQFMYKNELKCGSEQVEKQALANWNARLIEECKDRKLFVKILSPHLDLATLLIDTGPVEDLNATIGQRHKSKVNANHCEVAFILKTMSLLKLLNVEFKDVGIIAPFRVQVDAIKEALRRAFGGDHKLEVNTVDQYQGRDKDVILYSGTKTSQVDEQEDKDTGILSDRRRLNVAITRAKKKLILIGDRKCLERNAPFAELFRYLKGPQVIRLERQQLIDNLEEFRCHFL